MKTFLGAAFGALMIAGTAMAATPSSSAAQATKGTELASAASTPYTTYGGAAPAPVVNETVKTSVSASFPGAFSGYVPTRDSTLRLVNATGSGH